MLTDTLETQTTDSKTPLEILTEIVYEFQIDTYENGNPFAVFYATTQNASQLASVLSGYGFEIRPTDRHTEFHGKLQFWGWSESDIAESLG
jgi:hypothetical protein